jgi:hypothetical protein
MIAAFFLLSFLRLGLCELSGLNGAISRTHNGWVAIEVDTPVVRNPLSSRLDGQSSNARFGRRELADQELAGIESNDKLWALPNHDHNGWA